MDSPITSLYVHVPFCAHKCEYCAFYSEASQGELINRYVNALVREMELVAPDLKPRTVFFGGGTPSILNLRQWETILRAMERLGLLGAREWTIESNPATVSLDKAKLWRDFGVNRVSMGVQSLDERLLDRLGRIHSRDQVFKSFDTLRAAGFENINVDLMFAIPTQTMEVWRNTLHEAIALGSEHLSCYEVIYEEDTPLYAQLQAREFDVDEELACAMYDELVQTAGEHGLAQYEIANFARAERTVASPSPLNGERSPRTLFVPSAPELAGRPVLADGPFPLTPALSPAERENPRPSLAPPNRLDWSRDWMRNSLSPRERAGVREGHARIPQEPLSKERFMGRAGVRGENVMEPREQAKVLPATTPHPQSLSAFRGEGSRTPRPALPALACQHNVNYWRGGSFHGLGPSATGCVRGVRTRNWSNTQLYCEQLEKGRRAIESSEQLPPEARAGETAAFGLRMPVGWRFEEFQKITGFDLREGWAAEMNRLVERGWAAMDETGFRLNARGLRFADAAAEEFLRLATAVN